MNNPEFHECDCGYRWRHGRHGGHSCSDSYKARIASLQYQLKEREWIGVIDRLPQLQSDETMLVAVGKRIYAVDWEAEYCEFEQMNSSITHWMPLPSPPIGEKTNG